MHELNKKKIQFHEKGDDDSYKKYEKKIILQIAKTDLAPLSDVLQETFVASCIRLLMNLYYISRYDGHKRLYISMSSHVNIELHI